MRNPLLQASVFVLLLLGGAAVSGGARAAGAELDCPALAVTQQPVQPITLRVALYPFVPDRLALFEKIEAI